MNKQIEEEMLILKAVILYYEDKKTQSQIAEDMGITKSKVFDLLRKAQDLNYVTTKIYFPKNVDLSFRLQKLFNEEIPDPYVYVVPHIMLTGGKTYEIQRSIGIAAARYFEDNVRKGFKVAIDYGATVFSMIAALRPHENLRNLKLYPIASGPYYDPHTSTMALIGMCFGKFGENFGLEPHYLPPPTTNKEKELEKDPEILKTLEKAENADIYFLGMGTLKSERLSRLIKTLKIDTQKLKDAGVIGTCASNALNEHGKPVSTDLDKIIFKISGEKIMEIARQKNKRAILIGGGRDKVQVIRALLKGGWGNCLITDQQTAEAILTSENKE